MKNKFVLTEEESKRILSLHKEKIDKERNVVSEQVFKNPKTQTDTGQMVGRAAAGAGVGAGVGAIVGALLTLPIGGVGAGAGAYIGAGLGGFIGMETSGGGFYDKTFKALKWCNTNRSKMGTPVNSDDDIRDIADDIAAAVDGFGRTDEVMIARSIRKLKSIPDLCRLNDIYRKRNNESLLNALDGDIDSDSEWRDFVWRPIEALSTYSKNQTKKQLLEIAKKCGYSTVDEYKKTNWKCPKGGGKKQLTDQEKMDKAEKCGYSSWNEYKNSGWKCKTKQDTDDGGGSTGEGGGGQTYPFDYDTILKAFPPDEIINPFEQGGEKEVQSTIVTDKIYAEF